MSLKTFVKPLLQRLVRKSVPVRFADTATLEPASRDFGMERGTPIDRHYIDGFLSAHADDVRGRSLEIAELLYVFKYGSGTTEGHVLTADPNGKRPGGAHGFVVGDLCDRSSLPEDAFDCFVCTQTLNFIYDIKAAVLGAHRLLRSGGVFLGTVSGIAQISRYDADRWGDYWRLTTQSLRRVLQEQFGESVEVETFGNLPASLALLQGLAVEDMPNPSVLDASDPDYPVILGFRAVKR